MSDQYVATIVKVPGHGIRLEPAAESVTPVHVDDTHLLILAVAFALGRGGYDHHPEPRDPATQVLEGVLDGSAVLPWRAASDTTGDLIVCDLGDKGMMPRCRLVQAP
jgi:hypothetical protein